MANEDTEIVKQYRCAICKVNHKVKLSKDLCKGRTKFPFPYVILHDSINDNEVKELLTILYIDNNLQIRHAEVQELKDDNIFSKAQVVAMTKTLFEENERLRKDVIRLTDEINKLKQKSENSYF
ncbi:MAG: hypothetical protein EU540_02035 [Promethearchaeota archaeon]|nr:MAG: hypothetical protein EU540_02035 [Candidatus Lokiarchaeota archaeon]